ncbi:dUTP diphosphatase [Undibacterium sp. TJN19]|uniref:dUTP diphosphatase n=1 Tax=Undibacterium sp. TJN19 TaxID=3413055 RepID=UPI003BF35CC3
MKSLQTEQAKQMLVLQARMNATVNPDWLTAGYPFLRAVVVEVSEALDHFGWKWWKKELPDIEQAGVELIDILHFMLSHELVRARGDVELAAVRVANSSDPSVKIIIFDGTLHSLDRSDPRRLLELLAGLAVCRRNEFSVLEACFQALNMSWDTVLVQYISKNVLNIFRQDNGYKSGSYVKQWNGREDNVHLVEIVSSMDVNNKSFSVDLYKALGARYVAVLKAG